jgi:tRNA splicing endonuclease
VSILEAAYFADRKVLPISKDDLLKAALINDKMALEKYHTIKYLRDLGYIVRPSLDSSPFLRLHRKGFRPGEDKTQYLIYVLKSEQAIDFKQISEYLDSSGKLRKELVIAFVDLSREKPYLVKLGRMNIE